MNVQFKNPNFTVNSNHLHSNTKQIQFGKMPPETVKSLKEGAKIVGDHSKITYTILLKYKNIFNKLLFRNSFNFKIQSESSGNVYVFNKKDIARAFHEFIALN